MQIIKVKILNLNYSVYLGNNEYEKFVKIYKKYFVNKKCVCITDENVLRYHSSFLYLLKNNNIDCSIIKLKSGEEIKNLEETKNIYYKLAKFNVDRETPIIAFGGGVVGDLAGFVAGTYLRGVPLLHVPTTLLSMVDSSIGGKTGVNLEIGKNLVGAFYHPKFIFTDISFIKTLDEKNYKNGLVEIIKIACVRDKKLFLDLEKENIFKIITQAIKNKINVIEQDPYEKNLRMILNFGHTIGHAIEKLGGYKKYTHGEAVSIGINFALDFSLKQAFCSKDLVTRIKLLFKKFSLPTELPRYSKKQYYSAIVEDKKKRDNLINFVFLKNLGYPVIKKIHLKEIST
jgi:3-dehydroquinate synthase